MALSLEVGILADLRENDPEGLEWQREHLAALNAFLASEGLPLHHEPEECEVWSAGMFGYSGLHHLRRIAAHLDASGKLPPPGGPDSSSDPVLEAYFQAVEAEVKGESGLWSRLRGLGRKKVRTFDHLIVHGDAEGYYLPADFPQVLLVSDEFEVPGAMVGSAPRLLAELERISPHLEIPGTLSPDSDELFTAVETQGEGEELWQRYAIETMSCVMLAEGCRRSIATGAALVFC